MVTEGQTVERILEPSSGAKKSDQHQMAKGVPSVLQMDRGIGSVLRSRQITLNSIYMQDISDILNTSEFESDLKDIVLTSVSANPN